MSPAEDSQEDGRIGVYRAKHWLESTTRVDVPWVVYEHSANVTITRPDGSIKKFDLGGYFRGGDLAGVPFFAEVKNYTTDGAQGTEYPKYLADCYCAVEQGGVDRQFEYMWITWHPFSQTKWQKLCTWQEVRSAVEANDAYLNGEPIDDERCRTVAKRLWLIVLSERQRTELVPTPEMVGRIRQIEVQRQLSQEG
jgi:hypothetical protein